MDFASEALVAVLSDAGVTGRVARLTSLPRLVHMVAWWAFINTGAVCTNKHEKRSCDYKNKSQMPEELFSGDFREFTRLTREANSTH